MWTDFGNAVPCPAPQLEPVAKPAQLERPPSHSLKEFSVLHSEEVDFARPEPPVPASFQPLPSAKSLRGTPGTAQPASPLPPPDGENFSPLDLAQNFAAMTAQSSAAITDGAITVGAEGIASPAGPTGFSQPPNAPADFSVLSSSDGGVHEATTIPRHLGGPPEPPVTWHPPTLEPAPHITSEPASASVAASFPAMNLAPALLTHATTQPAVTEPATASTATPPSATTYLLDSLKPPRTNDGCEVAPTVEDFSAPPVDYNSFNPTADMQIYQGKRLYATQRPLLELGRPWYQLGQLPPPDSWLGFHNPVSQQFLVFGDIRSAVAANQLGGDSQSLLAWQANLFFDWRLTGTERFHFNITPQTQGANNSRYLFDDDEFISEFNADLNFGFFEGDVGAILGGFTNTTLPFDLPIALGVMPLVIQNGIWLDDAFLGAAATLPARNSPLLDISNFDITFFAGWDKLNSPAFGVDDNAAKLYGIASWWEALNGYIEADYAFVEDRDSVRDRSYHNIGLSYTRRFGHLLSNSTRVIVNAGQSTLGGPNTADGVLLLSENSLITANPSTILPYFNLFAGFDRPQSVGRAGIAGGILRNTGILFETDNLTGYPTLDATANQTYGMALGLSLMPQDFSQQLVLEAALLGVMGDDLDRNAAASQRGLGFRYQLPLNNSIIFRVDGMYGFLAETEDISGLRVELRRKF